MVTMNQYNIPLAYLTMEYLKIITYTQNFVKKHVKSQLYLVMIDYNIVIEIES